MKRLLIYLLGVILAIPTMAEDPALTGTPFGSSPSFDYATGAASTTTNLPADAFDGNLNTFYASNQRSYTYVALDLGAPHIITKVAWSPRNDGVGPNRTRLALFEGANQADFSDALPLYLTDEPGVIGKMSSADVHCSLGFRYVRYVGPADAKCNVAEVVFYGHAGQGDTSNLYRPTNLPCVIIRTENQQEPLDKVNEIPGFVTILEADGTILTDTATTRCRGNASLSFPKKPYRFKFAHKHHVCGSPAKAKKWTLINNYGDKTLMRNLLAFELSKRLEMPYTPFGTPVDVILNGEYKGCYQLCDQIEVAKNRVDIPKTDGSYFIEVDDYAYAETSYFYSAKNNPVTIKYPDEDSITSAQKNTIKLLFNQLEANQLTYLDLNTFIRHFLVGEISGNTDTYWSTFMYKTLDDPLFYVGPVWDFDLAFENDMRTYPINSKTDYIYRSGGSCTGNMRTFVNTIINSNTGLNLLKQTYAEARDKGLSAEQMNALVDSLAEEMDQSQKLNFLRWPILNSQVHQNPRAYGSYQAEINNVKNYIINRFDWFDKKLAYVPGTTTSTSEEISTSSTQKIFINGQIYILKDNRLYDLLGRPYSF